MVKLADLPPADNPTAALTFLDNNEGDGGVDGNNDRGYQDGAINNPKIGLQRHAKGFNAVFLDMHVQHYPAGGTKPENYEWY